MWNERKTSKYLWCTFIIAEIAACATFIYISITTGTKHESTYQISKDYFSGPEKLIEEECIPVCETKECIYQSKVLLDHINPDVNPCEDFHHFACGRNFEKFDESDGYNIHDRFGNALITKVKSLLDGIEAETGSASEKLKAVYDSCMAYSSNEFQAVPTVLKLLENLGIPNWPNLTPDFSFTNNLPTVIANFLLYKEYAFIEFSTKYQYIWMKDNSIVDVKVNASLKWTESFYEKQDKSTRKYLVNRILNYFKLDIETISATWEELEAIHNAVINLRKQSDVMDEGTEGLLNCSEGAEKDWENLCETMKSLIEIAGATDQVDEDFATIYSDEVYFMRNIFRRLRKFTDRRTRLQSYATPFFEVEKVRSLANETHANSFGARILEEGIYVIYATRHYAEPLAFFDTILEVCTTLHTTQVKDMYDEGIKETSDLIMRQDWIKNVTYRQSMKERVNGIKLQFDNFFEMLPNETRVNNYYELIQYHPTDVSFLNNVFERKKSMKIIELKGLFQTHESDWIEIVFMAGAAAVDNDIEIYFGMMLPPLYVPGGERIRNMLALGFVITHEVGHHLQDLLDSDIAQFDPEGNEYYQEKLKCIEDQYSQFQFESTGKNLTGSRYLSENFADTVSISVMDKLVEKYASLNITRLLPALSYSFRQQMYIYFAQVFCTLSNKERDEYFRTKEDHAPDKFRLLGDVQNSKGFSEAFGCPAGSYLNPVTKCTILE